MASTSGSDYWNGLRDSLTGLVIDVARARAIDVERIGDDRNVPDRADLVAGDSGNPLTFAPGGLPIPVWVMLGIAVLVGATLLKKAV